MVQDADRAKVHYQDADVAEGYDDARWGGTRAPRNWMMKRAVRRALRWTGASTVLDAPCGTGRLTEPLARAGWSVVGADISGEMLAVAHRRTKGVEGASGFLRTDFEQLGVAPDSVDTALCIRFLNLLEPDRQPPILAGLLEAGGGTLVMDWRTPYAFNHLSRTVRTRLGLRIGDLPTARTRAALDALAVELGARVVKIVRVCPLLSAQWVVVLRRT